MEVKDRISYKLLCNACLCVGQGLNLITDVRLKRFYLDALNEIPMCNIADITPVLCWDCEALLQRAMAFKEQVKDSYQVLLTYTSENLQEDFLSDVSRSPRLRVKINEVISITPDKPILEQRKSIVKDEPKLDLVCNKVTSLSKTPAIHKRTDMQQVYLKDDNLMKTENNGVANLSATPTISKRPGTQHVYLKDDDLMKTEDDDCEDSNAHDDTEYVPEAFEIEDIVGKKKKKSKKTVKDKGSKTGKKLKTKKEPKDQDLKIVTIELSYDEMMLERDREMVKDSYVNAEYKCDTCILGFNYYKSYKTHLTAKHSVSIGDYSCPVCKTIYASLDSFTGHYKRHMRRYECSICQKRTMDLKVMQQHYYSMHEISLREYRCPDCGKLSNSVDAHRYHRESHRARLQCTECDKTFRHRAGLLNHRLAVHEFKNKFPCNICNKVFKWRTSLRRHQDTHENKKSPASAAYCELCGVSFSSLCSYQRHMNNSLKHITKDQLRFICDHCNIKFADKTKLRDHIEEKHLHRTFQCSICMKTSKNRVGLDQHIRNVHKGRPNNKMCHHCGKGFPTKVQLESHIRTHTGERPFICEYCPTTFSQQSNLYKHNRQVHLNVKSKRYPTCKKKLDSGPPPAAPINTPPAVSVVLHYSEAGYLTAEM